MKLLSQPQGKSKQQLDTANNERRVLELDALIVKKRKELDDVDKSLVASLSAAGARNYEEESKWKEKLSALEREVEALESRRKSALVPLQQREKEADDKDRALAAREESLSLKESDLEYTKLALEKKLDDVSEREQSAEDYAQSLNTRDFSLKESERQVTLRVEALTTVLRDILAEEELARTEQARRKAVLKGRAVSITEREQHVASQEAAFEAREEAILDKYRTLQRTITEVNLKNGTNELQRHP